jgi:hypothetical protein
MITTGVGFGEPKRLLRNPITPPSRLVLGTKTREDLRRHQRKTAHWWRDNVGDRLWFARLLGDARRVPHYADIKPKSGAHRPLLAEFYVLGKLGVPVPNP